MTFSRKKDVFEIGNDVLENVRGGANFFGNSTGNYITLYDEDIKLLKKGYDSIKRGTYSIEELNNKLRKEDRRYSFYELVKHFVFDFGMHL